MLANAGRLLRLLCTHAEISPASAGTDMEGPPPPPRNGRGQKRRRVNSSVRAAASSAPKRSRTAPPHNGNVWSVSFSQDGKLAVSGGEDGMVRIWDAETGQPLKMLRGHTRSVHALAFSRDGTRVASGGLDRTVRIWDAETGQPLQELRGHTRCVTSVAFSWDGTRVVSGSDDHTVRVLEIGSPVRILESDEKQDAKDVSPNSPGEKVLRGHSDTVCSVAFSRDGTHVVSGSEDKTARVWNIRTEEHTVFRGHTDYVFSVAFSPDGKRVVSGGQDHQVRIWNAETRDAIRRMYLKHVYSVSFSSDGERVVGESYNGTVWTWDSLNGKPKEMFRARIDTIDEGELNDASFSPDGTRMVIGGADGTVRFIQTAPRHADSVNSVSFSPDGKRVVTGSDDGTARIWDVATGEHLCEYTGHRGSVTSVSFSPVDDNLVASGSWDETVHIWDAETGQPRDNHVYAVEVNSAVYSVSFSPDGTRLAIGTDNGGEIWNRRTQDVKVLPGHIGRVKSVSFSSDGKLLAGGNTGNRIKIWNSDPANPETYATYIRTLTGHIGGVESVSFSPFEGDNCLVSGSYDGGIRIWNAENGVLVHELQQGTRDVDVPSAVYSVAFSQDGKRVVSGSDDWWARNWDAKTGRQIGKARKYHTHSVLSVACSPDGKHVVSGARDREIMIWERCCPMALRQTLDVMNILPSDIINNIADYYGEDLELKVKIH